MQTRSLRESFDVEATLRMIQSLRATAAMVRFSSWKSVKLPNPDNFIEPCHLETARRICAEGSHDRLTVTVGKYLELRHDKMRSPDYTRNLASIISPCRVINKGSGTGMEHCWTTSDAYAKCCCR